MVLTIKAAPTSDHSWNSAIVVSSIFENKKPQKNNNSLLIIGFFRLGILHS